MLKEIYEQPQAIRQSTRADLGTRRIGHLAGSSRVDRRGNRPRAVRRLWLLVLRDPVRRGVASRTRHSNTDVRCERLRRRADPLESGTLVVGVTQSGETADTLGALRDANRAGATTLAVTNVVASSAARECDATVYIRAGPRSASQPRSRSRVSRRQWRYSRASSMAVARTFLGGLRDLPSDIQRVLDTSNAREIAAEIVDADAYFFIGRGYQWPVALEGAQDERDHVRTRRGFPAGELKHGPLALVTERTPVVALVTGSNEVVERRSATSGGRIPRRTGGRRHRLARGRRSPRGLRSRGSRNQPGPRAGGDERCSYSYSPTGRRTNSIDRSTSRGIWPKRHRRVRRPAIDQFRHNYRDGSDRPDPQ